MSNTTWIAGVYGVTPQSGITSSVVVSDRWPAWHDGVLGTVQEKHQHHGNGSEAILSLRPVTFHYKTDTKGTPQFGLIAEEVAKVNPALVLPDKEGKPYTVRYEAVNAMLLNEFLKEHRRNEEREKTIARLIATDTRQQTQIEALTAGTKESERTA